MGGAPVTVATTPLDSAPPEAMCDWTCDAIHVPSGWRLASTDTTWPAPIMCWPAMPSKCVPVWVVNGMPLRPCIIDSVNALVPVPPTTPTRPCNPPCSWC